MIKIGLTGNIASGKSEVEKILKRLNYKVYDLDIISHSILKNDCKDEIFEEFNTLDRKEIGKIVFSNNDKKEKLENIIYPVLKNKILDIFEKDKNEPLSIISGALLFEKNFNSMFDKIIFVYADMEIRLKRLMKRNNFTKKEALLRINSQVDNSKKADFVINNDKNIEELELIVKRLFNELK